MLCENYRWDSKTPFILSFIRSDSTVARRDGENQMHQMNCVQVGCFSQKQILPDLSKSKKFCYNLYLWEIHGIIEQLSKVYPQF